MKSRHIIFRSRNVYVQRAVEQIIGREAETATLLSRCLLNSKLRVFGFAPRQFNRSMLSLTFFEKMFYETVETANF